MKKILKNNSLKMLIIGIIFCFLFLTTKIYAESLNDKVFSIVNPTTKAQIITNKKGNVLLSNIDPEFESIEIVYDVLSNEQAFLLKNYKIVSFSIIKIQK